MFGKLLAHHPEPFVNQFAFAIVEIQSHPRWYGDCTYRQALGSPGLPREAELRPEAENQQHAIVRDPAHEQGEELESRGVGPVQILHAEDRGPLTRRSLEKFDQ